MDGRSIDVTDIADLDMMANTGAFERWQIVALAAAAWMAAAALVGLVDDARQVFIVSCDCATSHVPHEIARAERRGGRVLYEYDMMPGIAIAAPRDVDGTTFARVMRRVRHVTGVRASGAVYPQAR